MERKASMLALRSKRGEATCKAGAACPGISKGMYTLNIPYYDVVVSTLFSIIPTLFSRYPNIISHYPNIISHYPNMTPSGSLGAGRHPAKDAGELSADP